MEQATTDIQTYSESQTNQQQYERYGRAVRALDAQLHNLSRVLDVAEAIMEQSWVRGFTLRSDLESSLLGAMRGLAESVAQIGLLSHDNVKSLEQFITLLSSDLTQQWVKIAKEYAGSLPASIQVVMGIVDNPQQARECKESIERGYASFPQGKADLVKFSAGMAGGQKIIAGLKVDDQTREFLIKLTTGRACLADLDDHLWAWIRERRLENRLSIGFAPVR